VDLNKVVEISKEKPEGDAHKIALLKDQIVALQDQLKEQQAMTTVEQELETVSTTGSEPLLSNEGVWAHLEKCSELRHESMHKLKAAMEAMNMMQYQTGRCAAEKEEARTRAQRLEEKICAVEGELVECKQASAYPRCLMQPSLHSLNCSNYSKNAIKSQHWRLKSIGALRRRMKQVLEPSILRRVSVQL
jgi:small-conductance mechanosensitive channel